MNESQKNISIIIPCYNTQPEFLSEAISSIKNYKGKLSYEIIIVDDGSTNTNSILFLKNIQDKVINVIFQENLGPAAARNTGVKNSNSEFILFLDSDDRLKPEYIDEGIYALNENKQAGVVYANAIAFGDASRTNFTAQPFDITELLIQNYIPMCAVLRKKAWEDVGGIDENLIQYEDWEFWIRIYKAGWKFIFINKPMFEYRIRKESLIAQLREEKYKQAILYIYKKHADLVFECYQKLYATSIIYKNDMKRPLRSFVKYSKKKLTD